MSSGIKRDCRRSSHSSRSNAQEPGASLGGDAIVASIKGAERVTIPETGHFPFVEQPQAFLDAVRGFLTR